MKKHVRLLSLTVGATITLLTIAGTLIVVGIFNATLNWDIFGPKVEALLYGVFGSSIALACVGVAMTIVLGTQEIVKAFRVIQNQRVSNENEIIQEAPRGMYFLYMLYVTLFLIILVVLLSFANFRVQKHRSGVFKSLVSEQMIHFQPKFSALLFPLKTPPRNNVSYDLYDMVKTLNNLSFVNKTTLYLPDPNDKSAMWGYTAYRDYKKEDGFARFFVAKDFEKSMVKGLEGNEEELAKLNEMNRFTWYYIVKNKEGKPIGAIRIDGNSKENFREYILGS